RPSSGLAHLNRRGLERFGLGRWGVVPRTAHHRHELAFENISGGADDGDGHRAVGVTLLQGSYFPGIAIQGDAGETPAVATLDDQHGTLTKAAHPVRMRYLAIELHFDGATGLAVSLDRNAEQLAGRQRVCHYAFAQYGDAIEHPALGAERAVACPDLEGRTAFLQADNL